MGASLPAVDLGPGRTAVSVSAGSYHTCAVLDDGSLKCWGYNGYGQLGLGDTDGRGDGAGEMGASLPAVDLGAGRTAVSVSVGESHTCAALDDGSVRCWGAGWSGQLGLGATDTLGDGPGEMGDSLPAVRLGAGRTATVLAGGSNHPCAVLDDGTVKCWGQNSSGQLGQGDTATRGGGPGEMGDRLPPVNLGGPPAPLTVTKMADESFAVAGSTIHLRVVVANTGGAPLTGLTVSDPNGPNCEQAVPDLPVIGAEHVIDCTYVTGLRDVGAYTNVATVDSDQTGPIDSNPVGVEVDVLDAVSSVVTGNAFACALMEDGRVKCWGANNDGQLGQGDTAFRGDEAGEMGDHLAPVDLGAGRTATALTAGSAHVCAVLDDGSVKCWGQNYYGQLGQGDTNGRGDGAGEMGAALPPIDLGPGRTAVSVSAGAYHTCAVLDDGSVKCWGVNWYGQLGLGDTSDRGDGAGEMGASLPAVDLGPGRTAVSVSAGQNHTCAVLDDGSVKCWGANDYGQLGLGDTSYRGYQPGQMGADLAAVDLGTGRTAVSVSVGAYHTCAVLDDGTVKCWGANWYGQLGQGNTQGHGDGSGAMGDGLPAIDLGPGRTAVSVAAGTSHTCAVLDDGTARCWGANYNGELGQGDTTLRGDGPGEMGAALAPIDLGAGRTVSVIAGGTSLTCAVLDDATVKCWGANGSGELGQGDTALRGDGAGEMGAALPPINLGGTPPPPALTVTKSADETSVVVGDTIHLHVAIENTGGTTMTGITVSDDDGPDCEQAVPDLRAGDEHVIDCTYTAGVGDLGTYTNVATVDSEQTAPTDSNEVSVAVDLPPGSGLLRGQVTDSVTGDPVSGALVAALDPSDYSLVGAGVTGADGTYAVVAPSGSTHVYLVDPSVGHVAGFAAGSPVDLLEGEVLVLDAEMAPALGAIEGSVTDAATGDPVADVLTLGIDRRTGRIDGGAVTAPTGTYAVGGLAAAPHLMVFVDLSGAHRAQYHDGWPDPFGATPVEVAGGLVTSIGTAALETKVVPSGEATVQGRVTTRAGDPVEGAAVVALSASSLTLQAGAYTDEDGEYEIPVDAGDYVVGFIDPTGQRGFEWHSGRAASDLGSASPVTAAVGAPAVVDAALRSTTGRVSGTVTAVSSGDPLADALVVAIDERGAPVGVARTDAAGDYRIDGVPVGTVRVRFLDATRTHRGEYHQDAQSYVAATAVTVVGGEATDVDAALASTP